MDDNSREVIAELTAAINDANGVIKKRDAEIAELKRIMLGRGDLVVPDGSDEDGFTCPVKGCWADIAFPYDQRHCMQCGAKFEWYPEQ